MVRNNRQVRFIEAEGYYHGVHFVPPTPAEGEIDAKFEREMHDVRHNAVDETKRLEAVSALCEARLPEAKAHWERLRDETQGQAPEIALPVVAALASLLAIAGETLLLAPVMDGFGIAEDAWQVVTAATLVVVASGLLHLALRRVQDVLRHESRGNRDRGPVATFITVVLALFALLTITVLGWWRAGEMTFAADAQGGEWSHFLRQNEVLTKICVTLLTLGLPFFAAAAFEWGFERLRYAIEWRRARREFARLTHALEDAKKRLQALTEKCEHRIKALTEQKIAWIQAYRENYELGQRVGARRAAIWKVIVHIVAMALVLAAGCTIVDALFFEGPITTARLFCYVCITLGVGGLYAYFVLKAWDRPTPLQLYRQRPVIWREPHPPTPSSSGPRVTTISVPPRRALPKGRV